MSNIYRVLLIGSTGFLGNALKRQLHDYHVLCPTKNELDITNFESIDQFLKNHQCSIIINAAACAKPDKCEQDPSRSYALNVSGPEILAVLSKRKNIPLIHFSTDYVFDGNKTNPYVEIDTPNPLNIYGKHKVEGEKKVRVNNQKHLIFRLSWLYGISKPNFFTLIRDTIENQRELSIVTDQIGVPNSVDFIAREITYVVDTLKMNSSFALYGTYHLSTLGQISWFQFAQKIESLYNANKYILPISTKEFQKNHALSVKRPEFSVLCVDTYSNLFQRKLPNWDIELESFFQKIQS